MPLEEQAMEPVDRTREQHVGRPQDRADDVSDERAESAADDGDEDPISEAVAIEDAADQT